MMEKYKYYNKSETNRSSEQLSLSLGCSLFFEYKSQSLAKNTLEIGEAFRVVWCSDDGLVDLDA